MGWPTDKTGAAAVWSDIQAIVDALTGISGNGDQVQLIQYNNSSNYALDVRNLDTTNSYGLRVRDASSNNLLLVYKNNITLGASAANDSLTLNTNISGKVFIGDSANADLTVGLTINQGANDDQILALKSSDVAHGVTTYAETDTYGAFLKATAADGGLVVRGLRDTNTIALSLQGVGPTDNTTKTTGGAAYVEVHAYKVNGTGVQDVGTDGNLLAVFNNATARLIVDAEGHLHSVGASSTDMLGNGLWFINDTANANMTMGLTINQGANDDEIFALKSSDVIHGGVGGMETDTFLSLIKLDGAGGGVNLRCLADGNMPVAVLSALRLSGYLATNAMTTKSTAGRGIIDLYATQITGGAEQNIVADGNLVSIRGYTGGASTTRFIFDVEGSAHANVEWVTYDEHDDLALLNQLDAAMTRDPVKTEFGRFLGDYRQRLQEAKIVNFYDDGPRAMVDFTRLAMLTVGALRQMGERLALVETKMKALPEGN